MEDWTSNIEYIRQEDNFLKSADTPDWVQFMVRKKKKRPEHVPEKLSTVVAINCFVNSNGCTTTSEVKVLCPLFGRNLADGFENEKNCFESTSCVNKKK